MVLSMVPLSKVRINTIIDEITPTEKVGKAPMKVILKPLLYDQISILVR